MTEELGKRVKVLEDIEAIKKMHINYVYLLCNQQWDDMLECFAEDATMELLGRANWWLPGWLDRLLPKISIEAPPHPAAVPVRVDDRE